jgi:hypothetical protein
MSIQSTLRPYQELVNQQAERIRELEAEVERWRNEALLSASVPGRMQPSDAERRLKLIRLLYSEGARLTRIMQSSDLGPNAYHNTERDLRTVNMQLSVAIESHSTVFANLEAQCRELESRRAAMHAESEAN